MLISIQGLILVSEPYYNEAGYERQKGSTIGAENARMYNEMAVLKLTQHMGKMAKELLQRIREHPREDDDTGFVWRKEILQHVRVEGQKLVQRLKKYLGDEEGVVVDDASALVNGAQETAGEMAEEQSKESPQDFPLLPVSKGFKLSLKLALKTLDESVDEILAK